MKRSVFAKAKVALVVALMCSVTADAVAESPEHPLVPAIKKAKSSLASIDTSIEDYSCTLVARCWGNHGVNPHNFMVTKVRHKPYSVSMKWIGPRSKVGQQFVYAAGVDRDWVIGRPSPHRIGCFAFPDELRIKVGSKLAMPTSKLPITEVGIRALCARFIEVAERETELGDCEVKWFVKAKIDGRVCTCVQVRHPIRRADFKFYVARLYFDDELNVPIRLETHDWPEAPGKKPEVIEEYTYVNLELNQKFTDEDFK